MRWFGVLSKLIFVAANLFAVVIYAQTEDASLPPAPRLIQAPSVDIQDPNTEIAALKERLAKLETGQKSAFGSGYNNGFFIESVESPFRLKMDAWLQFRHAYFNTGSPTPDENEFEFERARLIFSGHAFTENLDYFLQLDGDSDGGHGADFFDYYLTFDLGNELLDYEKGQFGIRVGKWKVPFNRARAESGKDLSFTDRSVSSVIFDINRSLGMSLFGKIGCDPGAINWEVALINGLHTGGFRTSRAGELDHNLATSGRISTDIIGDYGKGESDLAFHENLAIQLGGGFAVSRIERDGLREFASIRTIDSGATLASLLPANVNSYTVALYTVDMGLKYQGWSLIADYYFRQLTNMGPVPALSDHGLLLQTGYFVVPEKFEVLSRWARGVGDSSTLGVSERSYDELGFGFVWYIKGQNLKFTFDANHFNGAPRTDSTLNLVAGDTGWLYRSQFQFAF